ncbi:MAG TPA: CBS domain-containing protein [Candidatus Binatia bacterium]|nr:CBS domain-containing protein [Candidatus Binatia bacterium]
MLLVTTYMTRKPVTVTPRDTLIDAQEKMNAGSFRRLPVVEGDRLVGMITDRDLGPHSGHLRETRVTAAMTENPLTVTPTTPLEAAARRMLDTKLDSLPVVEDGKLVGIITTTDILKAFLEAPVKVGSGKPPPGD